MAETTGPGIIEIAAASNGDPARTLIGPAGQFGATDEILTDRGNANPSLSQAFQDLQPYLPKERRHHNEA